MYDDLRVRAEKRVENKIKFYRNFTAYVIVNTMLFIVNWYFTPEFWWVAFPLFFWGIGILKNFLIAFVFDNFYSESYRERKIQEEMQKLEIRS